MADIDMIPRSYRDALRLRRTLLAYGAALALALAGSAAAAGWLHWLLAVEGSRLDAVRAASANAESMRSRIFAAQQRKDTLHQASEALAALRGSGTLARLARALDGALNEGMWFDQLQFSRTHELLRAPLPNPLPEGIIQTQGAGAANGVVEYWRLASQVEIAGQARDHDALTRFLGAMSSAPSLSGVRFLNSAAGNREGGAALSFSVAGSLRASGVKQ